MSRPPSRPTHGVLFDVGYTLLDESDRLNAAITHVAQELTRTPLTGTVASATVSPPSPDALRTRAMQAYLDACSNPKPDEKSLLVQALLALGLPEPDARRIRQRLAWDAVPLTPMPGARDCLLRLRERGLRVGILANQPTSARQDLVSTDLLDLCEHVWLSDAVGLHKPDPAFFRLALSVWSMPPNQVAYVGDRPDNDVAPAKALGMHTVRLRLGPHATQQPRGAAEVADWSADSLDAVTKHLIKWAGG